MQHDSRGDFAEVYFGRHSKSDAYRRSTSALALLCDSDVVHSRFWRSRRLACDRLFNNNNNNTQLFVRRRSRRRRPQSVASKSKTPARKTCRLTEEEIQSSSSSSSSCVVVVVVVVLIALVVPRRLGRQFFRLAPFAPQSAIFADFRFPRVVRSNSSFVGLAPAAAAPRAAFSSVVDLLVAFSRAGRRSISRCGGVLAW